MVSGAGRIILREVNQGFLNLWEQA
ncbi:hypothetical protein SBA3_3140028 [Candidatus Sulfopaludibacter sp. SbA3]|nr:hypothetical protein SBA3_3140028 [Candidatus Sulfopaludibacter sp. SbA3]